MAEHIDIETLREFLESLLSRSGAEAGMLLKSEPEMAKIFGVSRSKMRRALDLLVSDGYLSRRHGSGTYLRKAPQQRADAPERIEPGIDPDSLLANNMPRLKSLEPNPESQRLLIGVSSELQRHIKANQLIMAGIKERASRPGYKIWLFDTTNMQPDEIGPDATAERLGLRLKGSSCDGLIAPARLIECYAKASQIAFSRTPPPTIFIAVGTLDSPSAMHPVVELDTAGAMERGLRILADSGRSRIAFLHPGIRNSSWVVDTGSIYSHFIMERDFSYDCSVRFPDFSKTAVDEAMEEIFVKRDERPDAMLVGDDHLLAHVHSWLQRKGLASYGKELALITLSNKGCPLPQDIDWSRMEFNPAQAGRTSFDLVLRAIASAGEDLCSFSHTARWIPGKTH